MPSFQRSTRATARADHNSMTGKGSMSHAEIERRLMESSATTSGGAVVIDFGEPFLLDGSTGSVTPNALNGSVQKVRVTINLTINNPDGALTFLQLLIFQDGNSGTPGNVVFGDRYKGLAEIYVTKTIGAWSVMTFQRDGEDYFLTNNIGGLQ